MRRCLSRSEEGRLRLAMRRQLGLWSARRDYAVFRVLLTTGMRVGEFTTLMPFELRRALELKFLYLPAERRKGQYEELLVHVKGEAQEAFEDLLKSASEFFGVRPDELPDDAPLVVSRNGGQMSVRGIELRFKYWAEVAGVDPAFSPHWLRHSFAVSFVEASTAVNPLVGLKRVLGHASARSGESYLTMTRDESALGEVVERAFPSRKRMTPARARSAFNSRGE